MGRGLSLLQRDMLRLAAEHPRLIPARVLADCYGFEPNAGWRDPDKLGQKHYAIAPTDRSRYHAAYSAVSRAGARLVQRDLLEQYSSLDGTWWALPGRESPNG